MIFEGIQSNKTEITKKKIFKAKTSEKEIETGAILTKYVSGSRVIQPK